jgi:hypothetical protein
VHLVLDLPAEWAEREISNGRRAFVIAAGELELHIYPFAALPETAGDVARPFAHSDLPPAATGVKIVGAENGVTALGHAMGLVFADVVDGAGVVIEARTCAIYQFMEYGGLAMVRATSRAAIERRRSELAPVFASGRPDFSGLVASLEDLYEGL